MDKQPLQQMVSDLKQQRKDAGDRVMSAVETVNRRRKDDRASQSRHG